jgi:hypothetical protein
MIGKNMPHSVEKSTNKMRAHPWLMLHAPRSDELDAALALKALRR